MAEYASTRIGIPFGLYHYTGETAWRELFVSKVPFFDPLSFPFLVYASYCLARWALGQARGWASATGPPAHRWGVAASITGSYSSSSV